MNELETKLKLYELKYTILRRATCIASLHYKTEDLLRLCYEIEGKTIEELQEIHKKWIGY